MIPRPERQFGARFFCFIKDPSSTALAFVCAVGAVVVFGANLTGPGGGLVFHKFDRICQEFQRLRRFCFACETIDLGVMFWPKLCKTTILAHPCPFLTSSSCATVKLNGILQVAGRGI